MFQSNEDSMLPRPCASASLPTRHPTRENMQGQLITSALGHTQASAGPINVCAAIELSKSRYLDPNAGAGGGRHAELGGDPDHDVDLLVRDRDVRTLHHVAVGRLQGTRVRTIVWVNEDGVFGTSAESWRPDLADARRQPFIPILWIRVLELLGWVPEGSIVRFVRDGTLPGDVQHSASVHRIAT
jgi:hypothetical protein